jgi:hypothetical protein
MRREAGLAPEQIKEARFPIPLSVERRTRDRRSLSREIGYAACGAALGAAPLAEGP